MKKKLNKKKSIDDVILANMSKKLKINGSKKILKNIYDEGFGELLEFCDEVLENTQPKNEKSFENDFIGKSKKIKTEKIQKKRTNEDTNSEDKELNEMFEKHKKSVPKAYQMKKGNICQINEADLQKQIKIAVNKISDKNMITIVSEVRKLFQMNGFNIISDFIIDSLINSVCQEQSLPDRFILTYGVFLSSLHFLHGNEIMALFLSTAINKFNRAFQFLVGESTEKICHNLISFICSLYYFESIGFLIIEGALKKLIDRFSDQDIEMILQILRYNGFYLRKNNPSTLKEIIQLVHNRCKCSQKVSLRASFMLETITAIKHNNPSKLTSYDPNLFESFKKILKSVLKEDQIEGTTININFDQILANESTGKWWLVGSAFSGPSITNGNATWIPEVTSKKLSSYWSKELLVAAKNQNYKDKTRIDIFCTLISSDNPKNAFSQLNSLNLESKERDLIIRVIVETCLQESSFNKFYSDIIKLFAEHHRAFASSLHFSIRDQLRKLSDFMDFSLGNLKKLIIDLLIGKFLKISVFKILNFNNFDVEEVKFFKELFGSLISHTSFSTVKKIFHSLANEKFEVFREDILYFILYHFHDDPKLMQRAKSISSISHGIENSLVIEMEN